jgi:hypothetical protein
MIDRTLCTPARKPDSYFGKLIRTDKNGTKYITCRCSRCFGSGYYPIQHYYGIEWGVCFRCNGSAIDPTPEKVYTPEHEAKLAIARAKREAKREAERKARKEAFEREVAEGKTERAKKVIAAREREQQFAEKKAQWEAERKASEWIGEKGEKVTFTAKLVYARSDTRSFNGYERDYFVMLFKSGFNTIVWIASGDISAFCQEDGQFAIGKEFQIKATIKDLTERDGSKATVITRAKIA